MNHPFAIALLLAAVVAWTSETVERTHLADRIENLRLSNRALSNIRAEHERLQRHEPFPDELLSLRRDAAELAGLRREMADREQFTATGGLATPAHATSTDPFPVGVWMPLASWKNLGLATPATTLQTTLWAAAAGEPGVLQAALERDQHPRLGAETGPLPARAEPSRISDRNWEQLLDAWLAKKIHIQEVRLLAEQRQGLDESVLYLAVKSGGEETKTIYLRFHRTADAWRLVVPASVVEKARLELAGASPEAELPH